MKNEFRRKDLKLGFHIALTRIQSNESMVFCSSFSFNIEI